MKNTKPILLSKETEREIGEIIRNAPQARWFLRSDEVLFISIEDLIADLKNFPNKQVDIDVLIAGIEASRDIALMNIEKKYEKHKI